MESSAEEEEDTVSNSGEASKEKPSGNEGSRDREEDVTEVPVEQQSKDDKETANEEEGAELEPSDQQFDDGLIYGMDEPGKKSKQPFDEGLIYGVNIFEEVGDIKPDEDYDSGLITDDAETRFRALNTKELVKVSSPRAKASRKTQLRRLKSRQIDSEDEYDTDWVTEEAEAVDHKITYVHKEVQTEKINILKGADPDHNMQTQTELADSKNEDEHIGAAVKVGDNTDENTTEQAVKNVADELKDDSETSTSTISRVPSYTIRNRSLTVTKVSQQVDESEYENTTADEKPTMPIRRKPDLNLKRSERFSITERAIAKRPTVTLADKRDKSPDEASDSYDADYESYDNEDDDGDRYEPYEISLADTVICIGFGYALVYT